MEGSSALSRSTLSNCTACKRRAASQVKCTSTLAEPPARSSTCKSVERPAARFNPCSLKAVTPWMPSVASWAAQLHASCEVLLWPDVADIEVHAMLGFPDSWSKPAVNQVSEPETKTPDRFASSSTSMTCAYPGCNQRDRSRSCAVAERTAVFCDTTKRRRTKPVVPDDCTASRHCCSTVADAPGTTSTTSKTADSSSRVRVMYLRPGTNLGSRSSWLVVETNWSVKRVV